MWYFLTLIYQVIDILLWLIFVMVILDRIYYYMSHARWWTKGRFKIYIGRYKWYIKLRKDDNKRYLRCITALWNVDFLSNGSIKWLLKKRNLFTDEKWLKLQDEKQKGKEQFEKYMKSR